VVNIQKSWKKSTILIITDNMPSVRSYINAITKSDLFKNISVLASGTLVAQLIPIALQPILRRQFSPEVYGAYSVYLSLVGILLVLSSLKYEQAIILPKKTKDAANVFFLTVLSNLIFNLLLFFAISLWKEDICNFLKLSGKYSTFIYFVPLGTFLYSFYQSINFWLIRNKKFIKLSQNKLVRRGAEGATQTSFSFFNISFGLIIGDLIGNISNVIIGMKQVFKYGFTLSLLSITKLNYIAKKYIEFPKFNLFPSFMSATSYLLPALLINKFYTQAHTGYFDLSKMVLSIPLALVATSISNVLLQRVAEKFKIKQSISKELVTIFLVILAIVTIEIITILLFGENLFALFFGENNRYSGEISRILVWSYTLNFVVSSFGSIFIALKKIKQLSAWQLLYFLSIFSLVLFSNKSFESFLRTYVYIEASCFLLSILLLIYIIYKYEIQIKRN